MQRVYEAIIIGGGFYGCTIAIHLVKRRGFRKVLVIERESHVLSRASKWNQARVHGGFHYPRDRVTANRSQKSLARFCAAYPNAIKDDHVSLYAIARTGSHINGRTFTSRMQRIGAPVAPARREHLSLFDSSRVEEVYEVYEPVFDANKLRETVERELIELGIEVALEQEVTAAFEIGGVNTLAVKNSAQTEKRFRSKFIFDCSYGGTSSQNYGFKQLETPLKYEQCLVGLMKVPDELSGLAITVMDGPFFSLMPFPAEDCYALSHVRYTPTHIDGISKRKEILPAVQTPPGFGRGTRMVVDAAKYVPQIAKSQWIGSFEETKTLLTRTEANDARPILFEKSLELENCFTILGSKIDNVFDACEAIDLYGIVSHG